MPQYKIINQSNCYILLEKKIGSVNLVYKLDTLGTSVQI